jgi:hypothetical protein
MPRSRPRCRGGAICREGPNSDIQRERRKAASRRPLHVPLVFMCSSDDDHSRLPLSAPAEQAKRAEASREQRQSSRNRRRRKPNVDNESVRVSPRWRRRIGEAVAALLGRGRAKLASHSTSAPAGGTSGGSSDASTIRSATQTRSTCFADLNDNPVRLLEGYQGRGLRR